MIINADPAHPQNNGESPASTCGMTPTNASDIIATKTNPIPSRALTISFLLFRSQIKKIYGFVNHKNSWTNI